MTLWIDSHLNPKVCYMHTRRYMDALHGRYTAISTPRYATCTPVVTWPLRGRYMAVTRPSQPQAVLHALSTRLHVCHVRHVWHVWHVRRVRHVRYVRYMRQVRYMIAIRDGRSDEKHEMTR